MSRCWQERWFRHGSGKDGCSLWVGEVIVDFLIQDVEDDVQEVPATKKMGQRFPNKQADQLEEEMMSKVMSL